MKIKTFIFFTIINFTFLTSVYSQWCRQQNMSVYDERYYKVQFTDDNHGWISGNSSVLRTVDGGSTWQNNSFGNSSYFYDVFFIDNNNGWAPGSDRVIHTNDGGVTWTQQYYGGSSKLLSRIFFTDSLHGWAVGENGFIIHTSDGGNNWAEQTDYNITVNWLNGVYFKDSLNGWIVGLYNTVLYTSDGGNNWQKKTLSTYGHFNNIFFSDNNNGWIAGENGSLTNGIIYHTTDGGNNWDLQSYMAPTRLENIFFINQDNGWAVGLGGNIIHTTDGGLTWQQQPSGTQGRLYSVYFTDADKGWITGWKDSSIVLRTTNGGLASAIDERVSTTANIKLFPIPCHKVINLEIKNMSVIKESQTCTIKIYNLYNQEIFQKEFAITNFNSSKEISLSEKLDLSGISEGIYLVEIRTGDILKTEKIIIQ